MHGRIGDWQKPKVDVFSLEGLIAWLEQQPADGAYDYNSDCNCLIDQYLKSCGKSISEYGNCLSISKRLTVVHPHSGEQTFGAALDRARAIQDPK